MTESQFTSMMEHVFAVAKAEMYGDDPNAEYDAKVQAVLDEYWPGTTDLNAIKREPPEKAVYTAMYQDNEVIVKSLAYNQESEQFALVQDRFLSFIDEKVDVAAYIAPGVETSDNKELMVTMSEFAYGEHPTKLPPNQPTTWITDEGVVRTQARWLSDFRRRSVEYKSTYPVDYEEQKEWDTMWNGVQTRITPVTIPVSDTTYGMIHGDAHQGNYVFQDKGNDQWGMTMIDFDNAQRSWFIVDPGTIVFNANALMLFTDPISRVRKINKMKELFLDEYGWDTTEADLQQGCQWRHDLTKIFMEIAVSITPKDDPNYKYAKIALDMFDAGLVPTC